jgi:hypothetical protein
MSKPVHDADKAFALAQVEDATLPVGLDEKAQQARQQGGDYSGAVAKTDQAEISLVRKLDYRMMPTLFVMYFLCVDPLVCST